MELLNNFDSLCFDLRDKICREVGYIKEIDKTKNNHKKLMIELIEKCYNNDYKYELNNVYQYLEIGKRIVGETNECYSCDMFYDKLYYDNLDYILMCDIDTDITDTEISFNYKLKENYSYLRNYYENWIENNDMELEELDMYELGFRYDIKSYSYNLFDFVDIDLDNISWELEEMIYENINRDNDLIKILIYECSNRKVFYGKLEKYDNLMLF
eukprot:GHVU01006920.1.p1 GENE.GHVU01006920.1~~GHVU01006920.1.p1  ORF type:complete len:213 (-),score=42.87 GHVU01006920.1:331-969(-)